MRYKKNIKLEFFPLIFNCLMHVQKSISASRKSSSSPSTASERSRLERANENDEWTDHWTYIFFSTILSSSCRLTQTKAVDRSRRSRWKNFRVRVARGEKRDTSRVVGLFKDISECSETIVVCFESVAIVVSRMKHR